MCIRVEKLTEGTRRPFDHNHTARLPLMYLSCTSHIYAPLITLPSVRYWLITCAAGHMFNPSAIFCVQAPPQCPGTIYCPPECPPAKEPSQGQDAASPWVSPGGQAPDVIQEGTVIAC